jgi:hypothetical protein
MHISPGIITSDPPMFHHIIMIFGVRLETQVIETGSAFEEKTVGDNAQIIFSFAFFHSHVEFGSDIGISPAIAAAHRKRHHHSDDALRRAELTFGKPFRVEIGIEIFI